MRKVFLAKRTAILHHQPWDACALYAGYCSTLDALPPFMFPPVAFGTWLERAWPLRYAVCCLHPSWTSIKPTCTFLCSLSCFSRTCCPMICVLGVATQVNDTLCDWSWNASFDARPGPAHTLLPPGIHTQVDIVTRPTPQQLGPARPTAKCHSQMAVASTGPTATTRLPTLPCCRPTPAPDGHHRTRCSSLPSARRRSSPRPTMALMAAADCCAL